MVHRVFAPMLGLWGALLAGLTVVVLPQPLIEAATRGTFIETLGALAQPLIAGLAAAVLGSALFVSAAAATRRARRRSSMLSVAELAVRRVHPIDPIHDLGSRRLDDPIVETPFATPAWQEVASPAPEPEPEPEPQPEPKPKPELQVAPLALDLDAFAAHPGRNGVWVEEVTANEAKDAPEAEGAPEALPVAPPGEGPVEGPVARAPVTALPEAVSLPAPGTAALARLRAVPPSELSLAEMVERFAGALHEHRASPPTRALTAADLAAREAALAEALKALAALSGEDGSSPVREPLRAVLAQLHAPRKAGGGAA